MREIRAKSGTAFISFSLLLFRIWDGAATTKNRNGAARRTLHLLDAVLIGVNPPYVWRTNPCLPYLGS